MPHPEIHVPTLLYESHLGKHYIYIEKVIIKLFNCEYPLLNKEGLQASTLKTVMLFLIQSRNTTINDKTKGIQHST